MNKFVDEIYDVITKGDAGFSFKDINISLLKKQIEIVGYVQFNQKYETQSYTMNI